MTTKTLVELRDIEVAFSGVLAITDLNLEVKEGTLLALMGPNGAGKTTTLNCISGSVRPTKGEVLIKGKSIAKLKPHQVTRMGIARTFQEIELFEPLTTLENLLLGRHTHFRTRWWEEGFWTRRVSNQEIAHRERVEHIIDFLDLEEYRHRVATLLPYGVQKRIELGRALAQDPELILLDEPTAGLNQEETEDMARYILDIKEEWGLTQLLISHDVQMTMALADEVFVMDFGRPIAHGTPDEVQKDPRVIAAYLGGSIDLEEEKA